MFNLSDRELVMYPFLHPQLTIFSIGLMALALPTAALRLLPAHWQFRKSPVCERTWPAFAASFLLLAFWFSQSVMPYRTPGALDYSDWPILQILHVEKRGLQFHETCVSVWGHYSFSVSTSRNDRRLFPYRFQQRYASERLPASLIERVRAMVQPAGHAAEKRDTAKPLREWNVDGWYFRGEGIGLKAYSTEKGSTPPQEIVDLFHDLERIPLSHERCLSWLLLRPALRSGCALCQSPLLR